MLEVALEQRLVLRKQRELRALAEEPPLLAAGAADTADSGEAADGGAAAAAASAGTGAITVPNLAGCVEYTGEPILLDQPPPAEGEEQLARVVPYQIEALLEALPKRSTTRHAGLEAPSAMEVQALFERLRQLPLRRLQPPRVPCHDAPSRLPTPLPPPRWSATPTKMTVTLPTR